MMPYTHRRRTSAVHYFAGLLNRLKSRIVALAVCGPVALLLCCGTASAASGSWVSAPSDEFWQTAGTNWSNGAALFPGTTGTAATSADIATFATTSGILTLRTGTSASPTTGINVLGIVYGPASSPFIIGNAVGDGTITFSDGTTAAITLNSGVGNDQLINSNIMLGTAIAGTTTITNSSVNPLTIAGNITGGTGGTGAAKTLTISGGGGIVLSGTLTKGGATALILNANGPGTLTLSGTGSTLSTLNLPTTTGGVNVVIGAGGTTISNT